MKLYLLMPEHCPLLLSSAEFSNACIGTEEGIFILNAPGIEVVFKIDFNNVISCHFTHMYAGYFLLIY